jgi:hypothetical protein
MNVLVPTKPPSNPITKFFTFIGILLIVFVLGSFSSNPDGYKQKFALWKQRASSVLAFNKSANKLVDSLEVENKKLQAKSDKQSKEINRLKLSAAEQRIENDRTLEGAKGAVTKECPCTLALAAAEGFKKEADTLKKAVVVLEKRDTTRLMTIDNLRLGISTLRTSNDSLVKVIKTVPEKKDEKFLWFIPKPSRPVVFVVGTITGAIVGNEVRKAITR